ncbi:MAG: hypothetical protein QOD04_1770 [Pseudonocardiales bacterium]|nr:hypothetical protein [Pseudonocardiales bacterium]
MSLIRLTIRSGQRGAHGVSDALTGGGRDVNPHLAGALGQIVIEREGRA